MQRLLIILQAHQVRQLIYIKIDGCNTKGVLTLIKLKIQNSTHETAIKILKLLLLSTPMANIRLDLNNMDMIFPAICMRTHITHLPKRGRVDVSKFIYYRTPKTRGE